LLEHKVGEVRRGRGDIEDVAVVLEAGLRALRASLGPHDGPETDHGWGTSLDLSTLTSEDFR
jgi:hypothetical protein